MKEFEIKLSDIQRILVGDVPYHFYLEVIFRVAFVYIILMVSMRLMGKRMSSQLSRNEMAAVVSLAAAIGVPLMNTDRGLLPAVIIAAVIITFQNIIAKLASVNKKFESFSQDKYNILVKDGVLDTEALMLTRVGRDRVLAQMRYESICQLGEVKRLYFEAGGSFSILKRTQAKPGLSVFPHWDPEISSDLLKITDKQICQYCGYEKPLGEEIKCKNCKHSQWVNAVISKG